MEKDLSFLTEKQKTVYLLKQEGKTYKAIAKELNISYNGAREHFLLAERRIRSHEKYLNSIKAESKKYIDINLNIVELKFIIGGLSDLSSKIENSIMHRVGWMEKLPYKYIVVNSLLKRLQLTYCNEIRAIDEEINNEEQNKKL